MGNAMQGYYGDESEVPDGWVPLSGYDDPTRTSRNGNTHSREYKRLWDAVQAKDIDCLQKFLGLGRKGGKMFVCKKQADQFLALHGLEVEAVCEQRCDPSPEAADDVDISSGPNDGQRIAAALEDIAASLRRFFDER